MKNKKDIYVIIGVFAVTSVLLALPLAPLRKSFDGVVANTNLNGTTLGMLVSQSMKSARNIATVAESEFNGVPNVESNRSARKLAYGTSEPSTVVAGRNYSHSLQDNAGNTSIGGDASLVARSGAKAKASQDVSSASVPGLKKVSTNAQSTSTSGTITPSRQAGTSSSTDGGAHPGLDPQAQLGSLPLGDGSYILLVLVAIFTVFKGRRLFFR